MSLGTGPWCCLYPSLTFLVGDDSDPLAAGLRMGSPASNPLVATGRFARLILPGPEHIYFTSARQSLAPQMNLERSPSSNVGTSLCSDESPSRLSDRTTSLSLSCDNSPKLGKFHAQRIHYWNTVLTEGTKFAASPLRPSISGARHILPKQAHLKNLSMQIQTKHSPTRTTSLIANMTTQHTVPSASSHAADSSEVYLSQSKHTATGIAKRPRFQCHMCPATFAQRGDMMRHIRVKGMSSEVHVTCRAKRDWPWMPRSECLDSTPTCLPALPYTDKCVNFPVTYSSCVSAELGERKFSCNVCSKAFGRRSILNKHLDRVHGLVAAKKGNSTTVNASTLLSSKNSS